MNEFNLKGAKFVTVSGDKDSRAPQFKKTYALSGGKIKKATLFATAYGVYDAKINGKSVSWFMAPGWTSYSKRLQVQEFDITNLLDNQKECEIAITVGDGWAMSTLAGWIDNSVLLWAKKPAAVAKIIIEYENGNICEFVSDESWSFAYGPYIGTQIYDGETYDSTKDFENFSPVQIDGHGFDNLIYQQGEIVDVVQVFEPQRIFTAPNGETIIDFGQNMTGFVEFEVCGKKGDKVYLTCAETLDGDGNFYNANYRHARSAFDFVCNGTNQTHRPLFNFYGFRYIRVDNYPGKVCPENFKAYAMSSKMERTGFFESSSNLLNRLFSNIIWGQLDNYLDVPTDCPQRDERLGWTGDAQAFVRTGSYNFNTEKFFTKWLADLKADQFEKGNVSHIVPTLPTEDWHKDDIGACGWADVATIAPWQIYLTYGNIQILKNQFQSMRRWTDFIRTHEKNNLHLWQTGNHFGDWLALDAKEGEYVGKTDVYYIASAFYAYSVSLVIKAYYALKQNDKDFDFEGFDIKDYEKLYENIKSDFKKEYLKDSLPKQKTQTAHVLALYFDLTDDKQKCADALAQMIKDNGTALQTGFLGTPYLLHVLSDNGYTDLAYELLLKKEYPSWLFSVTQGATTMWEHWDSQKADKSFWSTDMNSFNHYAYGAVGDWIYGVCLGINTDENAPGFKKVHIRPQLTRRLDYAKGKIITKHGAVKVSWAKTGDGYTLCVHIPKGVDGDIICGKHKIDVTNGGDFTLNI